MQDIIFVHGMFQNSKSWDKWVGVFSDKGYHCITPDWPLHAGEPAVLRATPPAGLGELSLENVMQAIKGVIAGCDQPPIVIGHSVGGLITQILLNQGLISAGVAIDSVAPNSMLDFDWAFFKNSMTIANPLMGNAPIEMDAKTFHAAFANTLTDVEAEIEFERSATHDSRNVLRDCMGPWGHINLSMPHAPLLLIAGEKDQIIPAHLTEKNYNAYKDESSVTEFIAFADRSHYICNEPGWAEVADYVAVWLNEHVASSPVIYAGTDTARPLNTF